MSERQSWFKIFIRSGVAKAGLALLLAIVIISLYTLATYPLDYGIRIWNNPRIWADNPQLVPPEWVDMFTDRVMVKHIVLSTKKVDRTENVLGISYKVYEIKYNLVYDGFPKYLIMKLANITLHDEKGAVLFLNVTRPDDKKITIILFTESPPAGSKLPISLYSKDYKIMFLSRDINIAPNLCFYLINYYNISMDPDDVRSIGYEKIIFGVPRLENNSYVWEPLKGKYKFSLYITGNPKDSVGEFKMIFGGEVYGFMGTDDLGRDLAQGLLFGFPVALAIGVVTSVITTAIGTALGIISGYKGGKIDEIVQRVSDIVNNFPVLPLLILISFVVSRIPNFPRLLAIIGALVAFGWAGLTILVRSMVLSLRSSAFVEAAKAIGASDRMIMFKHIFPNIAPFVFAQMIFFTPSAILAEAALSFLGLGDPTIPTWGQIIQQGFEGGAVFNGYWWWILPPGILIIIAAVTFVFIALGMEPVVNPKLQER